MAVDLNQMVATDGLIKLFRDKERSEANSAVLEAPQHLPFKISNSLQAAIDESTNNLDKLVENLEVYAFTFKDFGKEAIKQQKFSPDSFIQMALQYAFYRIHNTPAAQYETAATRKFLHGRTETIRSCSVESVEFARTMLNPSSTPLQKVAALKSAITAHKDYTVQALNGFGVDRHLLGLKLIAQQNGLPIPEIFSDTSYRKSLHMRVSTSQVASKCDGFMIYGPLVEDGYACCYNPRPNDINFGTTAFKSCSETSTVEFKQAIESSLVEMLHILVTTPSAKL
uniref:Choline/carnitine acyltransferase domain-containing protein n=1 Tax=Clastoptera arizonana TaxID=38151 RepID=A0A1B6C065_9HEMI